jgi:hypothetical protein
MAEKVTVIQKTEKVNVTQKTNKVTVATKGTQGAKGDTGATGQTGSTGPAGTSGGSFRYEQQSESATWNINHNLGYHPAITIQDYGQNTIEGSIEYIDSTDVILTFSVPVSGYAYLS